MSGICIQQHYCIGDVVCSTFTNVFFISVTFLTFLKHSNSFLDVFYAYGVTDRVK